MIFQPETESLESLETGLKRKSILAPGKRRARKLNAA